MNTDDAVPIAVVDSNFRFADSLVDQNEEEDIDSLCWSPSYIASIAAIAKESNAINVMN